jgi:hypothetical protein
MNRYPQRTSVSEADIDRARRAQATDSYLIQSVLAGVDAVAKDMERKWGVGRLRLVVNDLLRAKFDRQKDLLDDAITANDAAQVEKHGSAMKRAYEALDRSATESGQKPMSPHVWELVVPSTGEVVALVRTEAEAHHAAGRGTVYTLADIAQIIDALPDAVSAVKAAWPTSRLTVKTKPPPDWDNGGDPIPF